MKSKKLNYPFVVYRDFNEEQYLKNLQNINTEIPNIPAYLDLIMHNQGVLSWKLNKLLARKKKDESRKT